MNESTKNMDNWLEDVLDKCTECDILTYGKNILLKKLIKGNDILDVGCGAGVLLEDLYKDGKNVTGIDISIKAIKSAKRRFKGKKASFYNTSLEKLKIKKKFDTVICSEVLEHIKDDTSFIRLLKNFISDNGRLVLTVPSHKWLFGEHDKVYGHYRRYTKDELIEKLKKAGLKVEYIRYWNLISLLPSIYYSRIAKKRPPYKQTMEKISSNKFAKKIFDVMLKLDILLSKNFGITLVAVCTKSRQ